MSLGLGPTTTSSRRATSPGWRSHRRACADLAGALVTVDLPRFPLGRSGPPPPALSCGTKASCRRPSRLPRSRRWPSGPGGCPGGTTHDPRQPDQPSRPLRLPHRMPSGAACLARPACRGLSPRARPHPQRRAHEADRLGGRSRTTTLPGPSARIRSRAFATWSAATHPPARERRPRSCSRVAWGEAAPHPRGRAGRRRAMRSALERTLDSLRRTALSRVGTCPGDRRSRPSDTGPATHGSPTRLAGHVDDRATVLSDGCVVRRHPCRRDAPPPRRWPSSSSVARVTPNALLAYGDEISRRTVPCLEAGLEPAPRVPPWPYLGHAVFAAPCPFHAGGARRDPAKAAFWRVPARRDPASRFVASCSPVPVQRWQRFGRKPCPSCRRRGGPARAAIIVLTRDHPALLTRLVASIRARTKPGDLPPRHRRQWR